MAGVAGLAGPQPRPLEDAAEAAECARLMARSEPWLTLRRTEEDSLAILIDPAREVYVLREGAVLAAFLIVDMRGPLRGYIQTICVADGCRGRGLGTSLLRWAEERIGRESPNVFLCVSSFNDGARRLYERLGYATVGRLTDFMVAGHDEILMRKTTAPWSEFRR